MHTTNIETNKYGRVTIHHNQDYSGMVQVTWIDETVSPRVVKSAFLPGEIFILASRAIAIDQVRNAVIGVLEDMEANNG